MKLRGMSGEETYCAQVESLARERILAVSASLVEKRGAPNSSGSDDAGAAAVGFGPVLVCVGVILEDVIGVELVM